MGVQTDRAFRRPGQSPRRFDIRLQTQVTEPQSCVKRKNHGERGEHGEEKGKALMEERFNTSSDRVFPRIPRDPVVGLHSEFDSRLRFSYFPLAFIWAMSDIERQ